MSRPIAQRSRVGVASMAYPVSVQCWKDETVHFRPRCAISQACLSEPGDRQRARSLHLHPVRFSTEQFPVLFLSALGNTPKSRSRSIRERYSPDITLLHVQLNSDRSSLGSLAVI